MLKLGLTGSIGMGKSTVAGMFRSFDVPVHDSDAAVHQLYSGMAAPVIEAEFPGTTSQGVVDRTQLAQRVLGNVLALQRLEQIVHPLVSQDRIGFLQEHSKRGTKIVVLDIPLLLESGSVEGIDKTIVVSAPPSIQRQRVLARKGMTAEKFEQILARQMPDSDKQRCADFVIFTDGPLEHTRQQVARILEQCRSL